MRSEVEENTLIAADEFTINLAACVCAAWLFVYLFVFVCPSWMPFLLFFL